jgi:ribulose-bisphosphate carboxylase small chain
MKTETFSYLPALNAEQVAKQVEYFLRNGWVVGIEYCARPDPALAFWNWWKLPLFNARAAAEIMEEIDACKTENPGSYIRITGYDNVRQRQSMSFVVYRP